MTTTKEDQTSVLIVDDDRTLTHLLRTWLERDGYATDIFHDGDSCLTALRQTLPDAICLDLHMPGLSGLETLEKIKSKHPNLPVLILTSDTRVDTIVSAMRLGAYDYLTKPVSRTDLTNRLAHAVRSYRMSLELTRLEREVEGRGYPGIIGNAPALRALFRQMDRLAGSEITILIHGESGSGKELVARAIHEQSPRGGETFVPVNCAAIPESLQESELFGHEKGSFTGATARRIGKFEQAHRGTLFLDEVAELSMPAQAKLLRVLQERRFTRVGATAELSSDFRLLAATHRNLAERVKKNLFREDLYFRIAVFELEIPPLRQRTEDLPSLAQHFLKNFRNKESLTARDIDQATMRVLSRYPWPGNVRELENAMHRASVVCEGPLIEIRHLPPRILSATAQLQSQLRGDDSPAPHNGSEPTASDTASSRGDGVFESPTPEAPSAGLDPGSPDQGTAPASPPALPLSEESLFESLGLKPGDQEPPPPPPIGSVPMTLEELEKEAIQGALKRLNGNLSKVCRELGIGRTTLYRKLKKYELR